MYLAKRRKLQEKVFELPLRDVEKRILALAVSGGKSEYGSIRYSQPLPHMAWLLDMRMDKLRVNIITLYEKGYINLYKPYWIEVHLDKLTENP